jgi:hypothetical protein
MGRGLPVEISGRRRLRCRAGTWLGSKIQCAGLLSSDRGVQFASAVWAALMQQLGVKHVMTTAYHPQSNVAVKRLHRRIKDALRARAAHSNWHQHLPWIMLGLRVAPRENSGISAAELVYGAPLQLPGQLLSAAELPPEDFIKRINSGVPCVAPLQSPPPRSSRRWFLSCGERGLCM